jgi:hypothetical protein
MYIDKLLRFSDGQAVTASDVGDNVIDLSVERSIGNGTPMAVVFSVAVDADQASGDEDYTFNVEYSTDAAQTTGRQIMGSRVFESGTPTAPAQDADLLVAGFVFAIPIPPTTLAEDGQFIGIRYVTAGSTPTVTMNAWLAPLADVSQYVAYADNVTIN